MAGLEGAKEALKEAVILPVKFPQFFTGVCCSCRSQLAHLNCKHVVRREMVMLCSLVCGCPSCDLMLAEVQVHAMAPQV